MILNHYKKCYIYPYYAFPSWYLEPALKPGWANFIFGPTFDLENFSCLVNLPFLFVLRKVTLLRGVGESRGQNPQRYML